MNYNLLYLLPVLIFLGANASKSGSIIAGNTCMATGHKNPAHIAAENVNDTQFLITAYNTGLFEIKASKLARRMTGDKKVRQFATMIGTDQEATDKDLLALLIIKGCAPPEKLPAKLQSKFTYLNEWMGKDFNTKYTAGDMEVQKETIALYTDISVNSKDAEVRHFAKGALGLLQMHEDSGQSLLAHINRPRTSTW